LALEFVDLLQGSFSLIFVLISLYIGISILLKYFKYKSRLYILVGLSWIGVANPWFPDSISFLMNLFLQESLVIEWYFIIGNAFIPLALLAWLIAYTDMNNKSKQKLAVILTLVFSIIFEAVFFILLFTDINEIGIINPLRPFTVEFGLFITIYLLLVILIMAGTGLKFAQHSIKSEDRDVKLKGRLLRAAFITFTVAALLDASLGMIFANPADPLLAIMVVITRVLLIVSAIEFYGGFILPKWMSAILTKN